MKKTKDITKLISILTAVIITLTNVAAFTTVVEAQTDAILQLNSPAGLLDNNQPIFSWVDIGNSELQVYELTIFRPGGEITQTFYAPDQVVVEGGNVYLNSGETFTSGEYSWTLRYSIDGTAFSEYAEPMTFSVPVIQETLVLDVGSQENSSSNDETEVTSLESDTVSEGEVIDSQSLIVPINLALNKTAKQSSTYGRGIASLAVDENIDGNYSDKSVTHTKKSYQPWWQVDLGSVQSISTIDIWNRTDCCSSRLQKYYILVSDVPFGTTSLSKVRKKSYVSSYYVSEVAGSPTSIEINRTGRYIRIQLTTKNYLSLAEVQVWSSAELTLSEVATPKTIPTNQPEPTSTPVAPTATQIPPTATSTSTSTTTSVPTSTYTGTTAPTTTYTPTAKPTDIATATSVPTSVYTSTTAPVVTSTTTSIPTVEPTVTSTAVPTQPIISGAYYVSNTGSDTNPGTISQPWKTLRYASSKISAGSTLYIRGGTYKEVTSWGVDGTKDAPITIMNYPGEKVLIDGYNTIPTNTGGTWMFMVWGDWYYVSGLEVARSFDEGAIGVKGAHVTIDNCYTHHNWGAGITMMGDYGTAQNNRVWYNGVSNENGSLSRGGWPAALTCARYPTNCTLKGNTSWENWGEGISTFEAYYTIIEDNVSYDNMQNFYMSDTKFSIMQRNLSYCTSGNIVDPYFTQNGILVGDEKQNPASSDNTIINNIVYGCDRNLAIGTNESTNNLIANNTFVNTDGEANILMYSGTCTNCQFTNNLILQEDNRTIAINAGTGWAFSNNLWSKTPSSTVSGSNAIISDPKISKSGSYISASWYQLLLNSPAIDKGKSLSQIYEDFYTVTRDGSLDIGAMEY